MAANRPWYYDLDWRTFVPVFVLGAVLHYVYPAEWWLSEIVRGGLSEALMIAAILGISVDRAAKDKLLRDVSQDIWAHLMGRNLPLEIKDFIKAALDTKLVCTRYEIRYRFSERSDGLLNVLVTITRRIENFGASQQPLHHRVSIFEKEQPEYRNYTCEIAGGRSFAWPSDPPNAKPTSRDGALNLELPDSILAPHGTEGCVAVITRTTRTVMRPTDTDVHAHGIPSTATVIYLDESPEWLEFKVDKQEKPVGPIWRVDKVLWTGGFHRVRWFDRRPSAISTETPEGS